MVGLAEDRQKSRSLKNHVGFSSRWILRAAICQRVSSAQLSWLDFVKQKYRRVYHRQCSRTRLFASAVARIAAGEDVHIYGPLLQHTQSPPLIPSEFVFFARRYHAYRLKARSKYHTQLAKDGFRRDPRDLKAAVLFLFFIH